MRLLMILCVSISMVSSSLAGLPDRVDHPDNLEYPELGFRLPHPQRFVLENGLVVYVLEDHLLPMVKGRVFVQAGACWDPPHQQGLATLAAEGMRTGGTQQHSAEEIDQMLEFVGGVIEASADRDAITVSISVLNKDLDLGLELLESMIREPVFRADKIQIKQNMMLEQILREQDNPAQIAGRHFRRLLYSEHPYGQHINGTSPTVSALTRDDAIAWHRRHFSPDRMVMAFAGAFDTEHLLAQLQSAFGEWAPADEPFPSLPEIPQPTETTVYLIPKPLAQATIIVGQPGVARTDPQMFPMRVFNYIYGGGSFTSRLAQNIRVQRGLAYSVYSHQITSNLPGPFYAVVQTKAESATEALQLVFKQMELLTTSAELSPDELKLAQDALINRFIFQFETPSDVAFTWAVNEFFGMPENYLDTYRDQLAAVDLPTLEAFAKNTLMADRQVVVVVGNPEVMDSDWSQFGTVVTITE